MQTYFKNNPKISHIGEKNGVNIDILRLDQIHPVVSGNKLFKLTRYLDEALTSTHKTLLTFGGAYSNHLHATAYACQILGLKCHGLVRGSAHEINSETISDCKKMGMKIHYIDRTTYRRIFEELHQEDLKKEYGDCTIVPSGGFGLKGADGASDIMKCIPPDTYSHICVALGSGTTIAGLLLKKREEHILAFPALKGMTDIEYRMRKMGVQDLSRLIVSADYHFGGFAKRNRELVDFMNQFYTSYKIPLDMIYTGKMMFGVFRMIDEGYFPAGSRILTIHTGGLQGNHSLPENTLCYSV